MYELKEELNIENMIYEIRGKQVMLDCDLAKLYNVETKRINEAVKNNPYKFPERFSFFLNDFEFTNLRSKFSTSSLESKYGGRRYNPRVFTEQGIAMPIYDIKIQSSSRNKYKNNGCICKNEKIYFSKFNRTR